MTAAVKKLFPCPHCGEAQREGRKLLSHLLDRHPWGDVLPEEGRRREGDLVDAYYREASRRKLLTKEAEVALGTEIRRGGPRAAEAKKFLVESNLRLVVSAVRSVHPQHSHLLDLIQDGNVGLLRAADLFDPRRGFRFSTYAIWWIRQSMFRSWGSLFRTVDIPANVDWKIRKAEALMGSGRTLREAAARVHLTPERLEMLISHFAVRAMSMDKDVGPEGEGGIATLLHAPEASSRPFTSDELAAVLGVLTPKHRHVVTRRFGLDGRAAATLDDVRHELKVSRERVRQIEAEALRILKRGRMKKRKFRRVR